MRRWVCLLTVLAVAGVAWGAPEGVVVLDAIGNWRVYHVLAPPVVETDKGFEPVLAIGQKWLHEKTPEPADDWRLPTFDDTGWVRGPVRIAADSPMVKRLCVRGEFVVTDPSKVRDLKLSVGYHGGAIVYVNGSELARKHLKPGETGRNSLAETYPEEAYYFGSTRARDYRSKKVPELRRIRTRKLENVAVPVRLLRKGVNVLAVEVIRPAEHKSVLKGEGWHKHRTPAALNWPTCRLLTVQLTASGARGLVPNAVRPKGLQVWNSSVLANDFSLDFGDATEPLRPIEIVGARGGSFSGKVVVGSDKAIKGIEATMGPLTGAGVIPPSSVRVRYAVAWGNEYRAEQRYSLLPTLYGALEETPPKDVPVVETRRAWRAPDFPGSPKPVIGAVVPVWVTVDVPRTARPGDYRGTLSIRMKGEKPVKVPVRLSVEDWTLPATQDYRTWIGLIQSPDTLVEEYKLKPWSSRHFAMMAKSFKHLERIGSRLLYIPVICHTNMGNAESMVRWVPKPGGTYTWDFSLMDRYLDLATTHMGKPKVVVFWVWEKFLFPTTDDPKTFEQYRPDRPGRRRRKPRTTDGPEEYIGRGPKVTVINPHTGKSDTHQLRYLLDAKSKAIWKPLFAELRRRMKARGLEDTIMMGTPSDIVPRQAHFDFYKEVAPGWRWVNNSHFDVSDLYKSRGGKLGYYSTVMNVFFCKYPEEGRHYGWKRKELHAHLRSRWGKDYFSLTIWRHMAEVNITGEQRGVGRLGADMWMAIKDKRGTRRGRIFRKYPEAGWRSNDLCSSLLAPGKDGPIATVRYEMTLEGVQECEARIFIETALTDAKLKAKLGADLAGRAQDVLDERIPYMIKGMSNLNLDSYVAGWSTNATLCWWNGINTEGHKWFLGTGWEARTRKLFRVAGEVQRKLGPAVR